MNHANESSQDRGIAPDKDPNVTVEFLRAVVIDGFLLSGVINLMLNSLGSGMESMDLTEQNAVLPTDIRFT